MQSSRHAMRSKWTSSRLLFVRTSSWCRSCPGTARTSTWQIPSRTHAGATTPLPSGQWTATRAPGGTCSGSTRRTSGCRTTAPSSPSPTSSRGLGAGTSPPCLASSRRSAARRSMSSCGGCRARCMSTATRTRSARGHTRACSMCRTPWASRTSGARTGSRSCWSTMAGMPACASGASMAPLRRDSPRRSNGSRPSPCRSCRRAPSPGRRSRTSSRSSTGCRASPRPSPASAPPSSPRRLSARRPSGGSLKSSSSASRTCSSSSPTASRSSRAGSTAGRTSRSGPRPRRALHSGSSRLTASWAWTWRDPHRRRTRS
mmetsp:Transcript_108077/g.338063  ORF Transcript_108077/g.338063 Transcript_108077/m.338063 type:complete len:316 (+) Transcript_108077:499-1446(+)